MTAEPSLFPKANKEFMDAINGGPRVLDDWLEEHGEQEIRNIVKGIIFEYEQRIAGLEKSNKNMASRLKKLMEKK